MTASAFNFQHWASVHQQRVEDALSGLVPAPNSYPSHLHEAMRYVVLGGGKRIRALLCYAAAELVGAHASGVDTAASAVELMHAFSLVHDDMPCMDDDDLRRGKPSCHKQYDEATALLVGDALQTLAFEAIAQTEAPNALKQIQILARATGSRGMCGGQAVDLQQTGKMQSLTSLETMHQHKTGALIRASILMGAYSVTEMEAIKLQALERYGKNIGLAFQVVDDILDTTADSTTLGKTAGKDALQEKSTYVSLMGLAEAKNLADAMFAEAIQSLSDFDDRAEPLRGIARFICERSA